MFWASKLHRPLGVQSLFRVATCLLCTAVFSWFAFASKYFFTLGGRQVLLGALQAFLLHVHDGLSKSLKLALAMGLTILYLHLQSNLVCRSAFPLGVQLKNNLVCLCISSLFSNSFLHSRALKLLFLFFCHYFWLCFAPIQDVFISSSCC